MPGYFVGKIDTELSINGTGLATDVVLKAANVGIGACNVAAGAVNIGVEACNVRLGALNVLGETINTRLWDMNTTLHAVNIIAGAVNIGVEACNVRLGAINIGLSDINSKMIDYPVFGAAVQLNVSGTSAMAGPLVAGKYFLSSTVATWWEQAATPVAEVGGDSKFLPAGVLLPCTLAATNIAGITTGGTGTLIATPVG